MGEPLKVVMLTTSYPRWEGDSAGHFVASLAEELALEGHTVTVIAPHERGSLVNERVRSVSVHRFRYAPESLERLAYGDGIVLNLRRNPIVVLAATGLVLGMRRALRAYGRNADVIHVHWAPTAALAAPRDSGIPMVLTLHGSDTSLASRGRLWRFLLKRGIGCTDAISAVAPPQISVVRKTGFVGPIELIPSGVPAVPLARKRTRSVGPGTIIYVGRLLEAKGVRDLLEAFISSADELGDTRLVFVGDGPLRDTLKRLADVSTVAERVVFEGAVAHDRALELIADSDLLVLPSYAEGSPLAVTEALALGTPVLGTAVGGVPELVQEAGAIIEPGDTGALAAGLVNLLADRESLAALGEAARARIAETLTWPAVACRTEQLYRSAIRRRGDGE
ncbi:MAG: glycosyltransferase family 4 protein [Coriobacteriia bacterium]|nr:glycosyltransferase family 4 protein [Coriobacteriia bacterium]